MNVDGSKKGGTNSVVILNRESKKSRIQKFIPPRVVQLYIRLARNSCHRSLYFIGPFSLVLSIIGFSTVQVAQALGPDTGSSLPKSLVSATPTSPPSDSGVHIKPFPPSSSGSSSQDWADVYISGVNFYLPWGVGQAWTTTNGNCGDGHSCDQQNEFAWDFVPSGSASDEIAAVADGKVCYVQKNIPDSTLFGGPHAGNVIVIAHQGNCTERSSGAYSFYAHLKYGSITVNTGQQMIRGEVIARRGQSGFAYGPHLHFSINNEYWTYTGYGWKTASGVTAAASFSDADVAGHSGVPRAGYTYISDNSPPCSTGGVPFAARLEADTFTLGDFSILSTPSVFGEESVGEVGKIVDALTDSPQTIILNRSYTRPVVFAQPLSYDGGDQAVVRITDVQADRFTLYVHDAPNLGGGHTSESVSYIVLEEGNWKLLDGTLLNVGTVTTTATVGKRVNNVWQPINFSSAFGSAPIAISQVQTENDLYWVKTRQQNVTASGFDLALEEDENSASAHGSETIGWLAVDAGSGTWSGHKYEASKTSNAVTESWCDIYFGQSFTSTPRFVGMLMTYDGADNSHLRYKYPNSGRVKVFVEEDTTYDSETGHGTEVVGFLAIETNGDLMAERLGSILYLPILFK